MDNEQAIDSSVQSQAAPIAESTDSSSNDTVTSNATSTSEQTPAPVVEKTFTQAQVQAIAAKESRKAAENARQAEAARYAQEREAQQQQQSSEQPQNIGGMPQQTKDQIRQLIFEEANKISRQSMAAKIEGEWLSAMNEAKDNDPEFAEAYDALNIEAHPEMVLWMNGMENKAAMVKDMANNPAKFSNILMLARGGSPKLAQKELSNLSASIKANEAAQKTPKVDAPLSQIKPSNIGSDNGEMSVSDYKNQSWLRG